MSEGGTAMGNVISSLTTTVSADSLWATVGSAVPLIGVALIFGLGFYVVKKLLKGESKGKLRM